MNTTVNLNNQPNSSSPAGAPTPQGNGVPIPPPAPRQMNGPAAPRQMNGPAAPRQMPQTGSRGAGVGAKVAVGLGAAAVAGGATAAAMSMMDNDEELVAIPEDEETMTPEEEILTPEEENHQEPTVVQSSQASAAGSQASTGGIPDPFAGGSSASGYEGPATEMDEPVPASVAGNTPSAGNTSSAGNTPSTGETPSTGTAQAAGETPISSTGDEPILEIADPDPEEVALDIISGEEIDYTEPMSGAAITFTGVDTVYTIEGDEVVSGTYIDANGNEFAMVDIDNDGFFDEVQDEYGNEVIIQDQYGNQMHGSDLGLSVSDAEEQVTVGYLAQDDDEIETFDDEFGDDYLDDIITV